eukprot:2730466-Prymnesium_polylepis.1
MVTLIPPQTVDANLGPTKGAYVFVIDVSGSMNAAAAVTNDDGDKVPCRPWFRRVSRASTGCEWPRAFKTECAHHPRRSITGGRCSILPSIARRRS